jgi:HEAT repeat protein
MGVQTYISAVLEHPHFFFSFFAFDSHSVIKFWAGSHCVVYWGYRYGVCCQPIRCHHSINAWQIEYIPRSIWGKYSAVNNTFMSLAGVIAVSIAGYIVSLWTNLTGYMLLFGIALLFGVMAVWSASHIPGGAPLRSESKPKPDQKKERLLSSLSDRRFKNFIIGASLISLATVPLAAFVPLFMRDAVGINVGQVVLLQTGALVGGLISGYLWGWAADRYGSRPVMILGVGFITFLPLLWIIMPRASTWSFLIALGISFLRGAMINSWTIGSARMLYAFVIPPERKVTYLAVYTAWMGIIAGMSQMAGGWLLDLTEGIDLQLGGFQLDSYILLFILSMILGLISLLFLRQVKADSRVSVSQFAGLFLHGNPILAMESMIRFHYARNEPATVSMTERLGRSGSPLTVDELLEALRDPRFYVRFEAIVSIARRAPDEQLIDALAQVIRGNDPSLSVIAAWALGRIGDPKGIPALREGLNSTYRSIRAHAARSLGSLEDVDAAPLLLNLLRSETDHGLQVAFAAALGRLQKTQAVPDLLGILGSENEPEAKMEISLALARMMGDENAFIQLWRLVQEDPGTTISRAVLDFRKKIAGGTLSEKLPAKLDECMELFARQQLKDGSGKLAEILADLPEDHFETPARLILAECAAQLGSVPDPGFEYVAPCPTHPEYRLAPGKCPIA